MNFDIGKYFYIIFVLLVSSCASIPQQVQTLSSEFNQFEPTLSGNGKKLAFIIENNGKKFIRLQDLRTGKVLPFRYLSNYELLSSPALSWNGRYVAAIVKFGDRRLVVIEDLISGKFYRVPSNFGNASPVSLSMSPDASKIVLQFDSNGKSFLEFFDLRKKIKLDLSPYSDSIFLKN